MAQLVQREITDYFPTAEQFADANYHYDRLWRQTLYFFKVKVFKLMYHYARKQSSLANGAFPDRWFVFENNLPRSHVMNRHTFKLVLQSRNLNIYELQHLGYNQMSTNEIEVFDQGTAEDFLLSIFSQEEFAIAARQVQDLVGREADM